MKIGILTFQHANNYGATLQMYAMQQFLLQMGHDVVVVNYQQQNIAFNYRIFQIRRNSLLKSLLASLLNAPKRIRKNRAFRLFRRKYVQLTRPYSKLSGQIEDIDCYVAGSDQIWNSSITNADSNYFLTFLPPGFKKISYAASIGEDTPSSTQLRFLQENIENLDFISVRESSLCNILSGLTQKPVTCVLDPTLLLNEGKWEALCATSCAQDYILVYMVSFEKETYKTARIIADYLGKRVLTIGGPRVKRKQGFKRISGAGPIEFLSLFKNASFVVTNSFHGTAFAISFKRDFLTIAHPTRSSRMRDLLHLLHLDDHLINSHTQALDHLKLNTDYHDTFEILESTRLKSLSFLQESLS